MIRMSNHLKMKEYIIQVIGKLSGYRDLNILVSGNAIRAKLVSEALKKSTLNNSEIVFYVPESLVTQVTDDPHEAASYIRNHRSLEKIFQEKIRENGLLEEDFKVRIVKSAGLYIEENQKYRIHFKNDLNSIITYLFLDLLELGDANIIADVSSGQNFYVVALLEALRHLLVYRKLENIFCEHKPKFTISTITPPPPTGAKEFPLEPQPVDLFEIDVKVFFEYPFKDTSKQGGKISVSLGDYISKTQNDHVRSAFIKELNDKFGDEFNDKVKELLRVCKLAFNALKHNAPLCFYHKHIIDLSRASAEDALTLLKTIIEYIESKKRISVEEYGRLVKVNRILISRPHMINTFLTIALFESLKKRLSSLAARACPTLKELEEEFEKLYASLNLQLNLYFLSRETSSLRRVAESLKEGEERPYAELLKDRPGKPQDPKRNFFAHAGLTYDEILVKKDNNEIRIRYREDCYENIEKYLTDLN